jgi:hypothetical protein
LGRRDNVVLQMEAAMLDLPLHDRVVVHPIAVPAGLRFPHEVVGHPDLSPEEQRAVLAAWASDASAIPDLPALRQLPGTPFPVTFAAIQEARERLDAQAPPAFLGGARKRGSGSAPHA